MNDASAFRAGVVWKLTHPEARLDHLGMLPLWFNTSDERPAQEQADAGYLMTAGCNYRPQTGFTLKQDEKGHYALQYGDPDTTMDDEEADPPLAEIARAELRDELIVLFEAEYVGIIQKDQTFVAARCD